MDAWWCFQNKIPWGWDENKKSVHGTAGLPCKYIIAKSKPQDWFIGSLEGKCDGDFADIAKPILKGNAKACLSLTGRNVSRVIRLPTTDAVKNNAKPVWGVDSMKYDVSRAAASKWAEWAVLGVVMFEAGFFKCYVLD